MKGKKIELRIILSFNNSDITRFEQPISHPFPLWKKNKLSRWSIDPWKWLSFGGHTRLLDALWRWLNPVGYIASYV